MSNPKSPQTKGPLAYENWQAASAGSSWKLAHEYPLYSDANITGGLTESYGPYEVTNTVNFDTRNFERKRPNRASVILRIEYHLVFEITKTEPKTDDERYHGGGLSDELASILSLCLGARFKPGGTSRIFEPKLSVRGLPVAYEGPSDPVVHEIVGAPVLPNLLGDHDLANFSIFWTLPYLTPPVAIALVRIARLYQEAVWIAETTPELSWLMLVSAVETAANVWRAEKESPIEQLRHSRPDLEEVLLHYGGDDLVARVAPMIAPFMGSRKKFIDFLLQFMPSPPVNRPNEFVRFQWQTRILKESMSKIYDYRSRALHGGKPFPAPMCMPPTRVGDSKVPTEIPLGSATTMRGGTWVRKDIPILLHTFEYIVRHALLAWWTSTVPMNIPMPKNGKKWTPSETLYLGELASQKLQTTDIAKRMGRTKRSIIAKASAAGVTLESPKTDP